MTTSRYRTPTAAIDPDVTKSWLRRALPLVKAHRWLLLTSLGLSLIGLIVQVQIPNMVRIGIDDALVARTAPLTTYVWWVAGLAIAGGVINYLARRYLLRTAYEIEYDMRNIIFSHLVRMPFGFYDRVQSGELMSRSSSDIRAVQMYLAFGPSILVQCTIAIFAFILMLSINVPLAIVAMLAMPVIAILGVSMRKAIFPVSWLIQSRLAGVATIVDENINGVRIVKAFAGEQRQLTLLAKAADRVRWAYRRDAVIRSRWSPTLDSLPRLGMALVLLCGGWMVIEGHTSVGAIVAFNSYVLMLQPPFRMLGMMIMMGQRAAASAHRIYEVLDTSSEIVEAADPVRARIRGEIVFDGVEFTYPNGTEALHGLDLRVEPGETVAVVGATGSGKSTVAKLLARFYDADAGRITIDGRDVRDYELAGLRDQIGIVPDEPFLFSVSIHDNIAYGRPGADAADVIAAAIAAGADGFIRELPDGYATVVGERGYTLSGGQRQRLAIARALLVNPPILVLDDATSAVDVTVEKRIHSALSALLTDRTTIIVAHRLSTIALADRVVLIDGGRVLATGTHDELLVSEPRYGAVLASIDPDGAADLGVTPPGVPAAGGTGGGGAAGGGFAGGGTAGGAEIGATLQELVPSAQELVPSARPPGGPAAAGSRHHDTDGVTA
ncbi:ATP-binding cassette subfamily B protein [Allocatelliglobosispora scoriae]|uniref:ATP-binding cassette subfamily B protein n=1 Tax=Allocatelliglobosispora scoriae TaxID=643052 RepID=A0A841BQB4_9ACTN|nr:ABC transporter ATP-binding protein [Allocatelliglobosispora scoriae]MBB5869021.1 ATP-binding cassette subfamily B protein [Allocatelliglobosispora scoriae]